MGRPFEAAQSVSAIGFPEMKGLSCRFQLCPGRPNIAAAKAEALKIAKSLSEGWAGLMPLYCNEIVLEIRDGDFQPVLTIPYSETVRGAQVAGLMATL